MSNAAIEENLHGENNFILKIHAKSQCSVLILEDWSISPSILNAIYLSFI